MSNTMDMSDPAVQDMLEQDKQEALARIRAKDDGWQYFGNYKMIDPDGRVFVKVVGFPSAVGTESMWVILVSGDENNGVGKLDNEPFGESGLGLGDVIRFGNGSDDAKPEFLEAIAIAWDGIHT